MIKVNTKEWSGILIYIQCADGDVHTVGLELIGQAFQLSRQSGEKIYAVALGKHMEQVKEQLEGYPIAKAYLYETEDVYSPDLYEKVMVRCIEERKPSIVLIGGTHEGRALAPRLAVHFQTGLTADCTALRIDEDRNMVQTRPAFGGNLMASIVTRYSRPQFATVRPKVMDTIEKSSSNSMEVIIESFQDTKDRLSLLDIKPDADNGRADNIENQNILVVAGRGVKRKEDLEILRQLAAHLGGALASSRALVEKGWMSQKNQIGLSGCTVKPEYMITCGVSGTVQFMEGMKHTKNIIAINTDINARIFSLAHYPICGDWYEIVPKIIERLNKEEGDGRCAV